MKRVVFGRGLRLWQELAELTRRREGKVYRTLIRFPGAMVPMEGSFLTTSKEVHLKLGQISDEGQWELADRLRQAAERGEKNFIASFLPPESETDEGSRFEILVTISTDEDGDYVMHLSPAN